MSVEEQLRAYGRTIEQRRVPIVAQEIIDDEVVMFDLTDDDEPRAPRGRWILSAAAVTMLVAAVVGLVTFGGGDNPPSDVPTDSPQTNPTLPPATVSATTPATTTATETQQSTSAPVTTAPPSTEPPPTSPSAFVLSDLLVDAAALGETVTFDDGAVARVNAVVVDAPPRNTLFVSDDDPETLTEFEIERCLGENADTDVEQSERGPAYARWLNPSRAMVAGQWIAVFDDGSSRPGRPGYHPFVRFEPGACVRAHIAVLTPDDTNVVGLILLPSHCCYGLWQEQYWQPDSLTPEVLQGIPRSSSDTRVDSDTTAHARVGGVGWVVTESQPIDGPLRPTVAPDTVAVGEPMATGFSWYDIAVLEVIDDADPRPNQFDLLGDLRPELPPQPEPGRKLVEVRAEVCPPTDLPSLPAGATYARTEELHWLIATDDNDIGTTGPESLNGTAGAAVWDSYGRDTFPDGVVLDTSNLLSDGSAEYGAPEGEPVGSPSVLGCVSGYVQIDVPDDATPVDVIIAHAALGDEYSEVGRTRLTDPS